ncbi:MAG: hypothetical protein WD690_15640 [Vicinamibacterales bacterium]
MATRLHVDARRLVSALSFLAIAVMLLSFATVAGGGFAPFSIAAVVGAACGALVAALRSRRGVGAALTSERAPASAGTINIASIPVIGIGGLGLVAMAAAMAWIFPQGRALMSWGIGGAIVGAAAFLMWRHFHGGSPFSVDPYETLRLR